MFSSGESVDLTVVLSVTTVWDSQCQLVTMEATASTNVINSSVSNNDDQKQVPQAMLLVGFDIGQTYPVGDAGSAASFASCAIQFQCK